MGETIAHSDRETQKNIFIISLFWHCSLVPQYSIVIESNEIDVHGYCWNLDT